jgi:cytochrome bd ubiquinol oxidase subunit I
VGYMIFSLIGFVTLYTIFIVVEMYLMVRAIRRGPDDSYTHTSQAARVAAYAEG